MKQVQTTEKYPSQINTKTIACRISSADYVSFLQDAISKGITLNDWLLMKIYSDGSNASKKISGTNSTNEELKEVYEALFDNLPKWKDGIDKNGYIFSENDGVEDSNLQSILRGYQDGCHEDGIQNIKSPEGLVYLLNNLAENIYDLLNEQNKWLHINSELRKKAKTEPSINDVKAQILIMAQKKFDVRKDVKEFMADVNGLLEELA
jgi:hypothetical protein